MAYTILRFKKDKGGAVAGCERHNERKKYEKYIKKIPKEILDEIDTKEIDKGKEMER